MPFRFAWICPLIASASASDTVDNLETLVVNRDATFSAFRPTTPRTPNLFAVVPSVSLHPDAEAVTRRREALVAEHLLEENFLEYAWAFLRPHTLWVVHRDIFRYILNTFNSVWSFLQLVVLHSNFLGIVVVGVVVTNDAFPHRHQFHHIGRIFEYVSSD
jgi:hypothetical protein